MTGENKNIHVKYWFLLITSLVCVMIVVGGLTRLTDSGLSITKWNLITGVLPPLSTADWNNVFTFYKEIPQYQLLNYNMSLDEFKVIFWWEYIHRLLGRIVGLLYIFPLLFFTIKKYFNVKSLLSLYIIFLLICFQGFIGWYMVQSGLVGNTDVSHYRLSVHLTIAFIILASLLWNYFEYFKKSNFEKKGKLPNLLTLTFGLLVLLQISIGALVSGLDAGQIYQTWPLMNENYFPDDSSFEDLFKRKVFETTSLIQFIHRNMAYFILLFFLTLAILVFKNNNLVYLRKTILIVFFSLSLQIILGIFTILSGAQIILASAHQIGSILLTITSVMLIFKNSKN